MNKKVLRKIIKEYLILWDSEEGMSTDDRNSLLEYVYQYFMGDK